VQAALHLVEAAQADALHAAKLGAAREGTAARAEAEETAAAARVAAAATVSAERDAAEARLRAQLEEAAARRDAHVAALNANHAAALAELKSFYDATSAEAAHAIKGLKDDLAESRRREASLEAANAELSDSVKRLSDQLGRTSKEADELRPGAAAAEKERVSTGVALSRATKAEKALKNAEWELEVKTQLADALKTERDELLAALNALEAGGASRPRVLGTRGLSTAGSLRGTTAPSTPAAQMGGLNLGR
jgi:hypothetical protein